MIQVRAHLVKEDSRCIQVEALDPEQQNRERKWMVAFKSPPGSNRIATLRLVGVIKATKQNRIDEYAKMRKALVSEL